MAAESTRLPGFSDALRITPFFLILCKEMSKVSDLALKASELSD